MDYRGKRIEKSKYNQTYEDHRTVGLPKYLIEKRKKKNGIIDYVRECKGKQHWREMEDRECRVCDEGEENIHRSLKE